MPRLDEFKSIGQTDTANDLMYIVDLSEGTIASGSRKITIDNLVNEFDLNNFDESRAINDSNNLGSTYVPVFNRLADVVTGTMISDIIFFVPGDHEVGRVVVYIIPPSAFDFFFDQFVFHSFGGFDKKRTNVMFLHCTDETDSGYRYEVSWYQE